MFEKNNLFEKVYSEGTLVSTEIWLDTRTGVNYLFHKDGNCAGLTPLLGPDGSPVITKLPQDAAH